MIITIRNVKGCYEGKEIQSQNHRIVEMIGDHLIQALVMSTIS